MALDPTLATRFDEQSLQLATAIKIELGSGTTRLFDGRGQVMIAGETYEGIDNLFGTMDVIDTIEEMVATKASEVSISLHVPDEFGMARILAPENQTKLVTVMIAAIDRTTGQAIGAPELMWKGRIDSGKITADENAQLVEIVTTSAFDRLFAQEEGARLNSQWHRKIWPNETGLDFNVESLTNPYWGNQNATGSQASSNGGYYGGGNGGGRGAGYQPRVNHN